MSGVETEKDQPKNLLILGYTIGCIVLIVVFVVIAYELFHWEVKREHQVKVMQTTSTALRELRAEEQERLGRYRWVNRDKGIVRIPLDRAIELTLRDWDARPSAPVRRAPDGAIVPPEPEPAPEGGTD